MRTLATQESYHLPPYGKSSFSGSDHITEITSLIPQVFDLTMKQQQSRIQMEWSVTVKYAMTINHTHILDQS